MSVLAPNVCGASLRRTGAKITHVMEPHIQYVRSPDGTNIAYAVIGEGVPMIFDEGVGRYSRLHEGGSVSALHQGAAPCSLTLPRVSTRFNEHGRRRC